MNDIEIYDEYSPEVTIVWASGSVDRVTNLKHENVLLTPTEKEGWFDLIFKDIGLREICSEKEMKLHIQEIEEEQLIGRMSMAVAINTRIQKGYTLEQIQDFVRREIGEYKKWFETKFI